ncbi:CBN-LIN-17 protein [Caenorhabditis brenneri]|uniref:CBN-LIN-17 protein n=1 Tax=Caenorhabditis brenneri TaxID=135651 RepID=G0NVS5_CAEBE|nr:CBN-LIN-17 protein [Caenorhabditis brenneri]
MMNSLGILLFIPLATSSIFDQAGKGKCIPIDIELCKDLPYNYTYYPNTILHNDQHTLQTHTEHFKPLMKTKCHPHIHFFICSVFAPMCPIGMPQAVTSCKQVCEQVKADCFSILDEFGIGWPEPLNCAQFPDPPELCMKPTEDEITGGFSAPRVPSKSSSSSSSKPTGCPSDLVDVDPNDPKSHCAFSCQSNVMFSTDNKRMVRSWSIWFAAANAGVAIFSFLTFAIDRKRFRFPERCVFYLSLCLFLSSLPYLSPLILDAPIRSCHALGNGRSYLSIGTFDNSYCLTSFLLNYFFSTAAALWWLMFSFTLYLSGGRKWVPEGIEACSSYVHFVAWGLSSLATIIVLIFNKVDASELTAICSVGNLNSIALLWFVIVPRTICIVIGTCFIVGGFASMCRERISFRTRGTDTSKLEKLMVKMGFFCALFILPNVVELVCQCYKFMILTQWTRMTIDCKQQSGACHRPTPPQAEIYMAAVISSLTTGFSCLMWVLSAKTVHSWKNFIFCGMCSSAPVKSPIEPSTRPLLEPPTAPPPQPPVYMQMATNPQNAWRPSKVV